MNNILISPVKKTKVIKKRAKIKLPISNKIVEINPPAYKFVDKQDRKKLAEGRNHGMGFAFCKRTDNTFTTINAITACKDFLNEILVTEHTGQEFQIFGLKTKKEGIFNDKDYAYLAVSILKQGRDLIEYDNYKMDLATLEKNNINLCKFINVIEAKLNLPIKTQLIKLQDNVFLAKVPHFWCQYTYLISLYTFLMRVGLYYDGKMDFLKYLESYNKDYGDQGMMKSVMVNFNKILNGQLPKQSFENLSSGIHHTGICSFKFPN